MKKLLATMFIAASITLFSSVTADAGFLFGNPTGVFLISFSRGGETLFVEQIIATSKREALKIAKDICPDCTVENITKKKFEGMETGSRYGRKFETPRALILREEALNAPPEQEKEESGKVYNIF